MLKYSNAVNHYTSLNLTKLDVLDTFPTIKVATAYLLDGQRLENFPADVERLERCQVEYEELEGWQTSTVGIKTWDELPERARAYVDFIQRTLEVSIGWIGTGPGRESMIVR